MTNVLGAGRCELLDVEAGRSLVRFTFCKQRSVLTEAVRRLQER